MDEHTFTGGAYEGSDDSLATMGTITPSQYSVKFESEAFTIDLPTMDLRVEMDEAGERVYFFHAKFPGWTIYSIEPAILRHRSLQRFGLKDRIAELQEQQTGPSKHGRRVLFTMLSLVVCILVLSLGTNVILGIIVGLMPSDWEQQIGDAGLKEIKTEMTFTDEPGLTNRLFLVGERLKRGLPPGAPKFKFYVADHPSVNACALPNGDVIVMRGLLEVADPEQLAGVLAHELAHVTERHGMRLLAQTVGPSLIGKYIFGGDSALAALTKGTAYFSRLEYSRAIEHDADAEGWDILLRANIDPRGLTGFFRDLQRIRPKAADTTDFFSTHPSTAERIQRLDQLWQNSPKKSGFKPMDGGPDPVKIYKFRLPF